MRISELINSRNVYVIAEVSQNHDGSLGQAHAFIEAVSKTGASAIKFQTHIADAESTVKEPFRVKFSYEDSTRYDYWKRMEWTREQWQGLYQHATECGLDFLSSPFSVQALEMLDDIGVPMWKFGSGEVFNEVLLDRAIATGKPIIISTGLSTMADIDAIVEKVKNGGNELVIMECTTAYPSKPEEIPIGLISTYGERYQCLVGISDHSATIYPSLAAVAMGAKIVEVHVTMSREMFGPDVKASVTMEELRQIVEGADYISTMLNVDLDKKELSDEKKQLRSMFSKSIYATRPISKGELLSEENIGIKKPFSEKGIGVKEYYSLLGKRMLVDIERDNVIEKEMVENEENLCCCGK